MTVNRSLTTTTILCQELDLDDLDDYDLFSYYVQQWDMYHEGRNLNYLGYDDWRHVPLAISQVPTCNR